MHTLWLTVFTSISLKTHLGKDQTFQQIALQTANYKKSTVQYIAQFLGHDSVSGAAGNTRKTCDNIFVIYKKYVYKPKGWRYYY